MKKGAVVKETPDITRTLTGNGVLLGLEAGDKQDMDDHTDNIQKTSGGSLVAYVKKGARNAGVKVVLRTPKLKSIVVHL